MLETRGVYILVISVRETRRVNVGSLGTLTFKRGLYVYVGSAQNNLEKRIERHFKRHKRVFWHIDYLLSDEYAEIINVLFKESLKSEECRMARVLSSLYEPVVGFGSSDCKCPSHLFRINSKEDIKTLLNLFGLNLFKREAGELNES
ncbi:MAG: GIY-YIG nuclease family protein [Candidatus Bathyarchaeia archaeon]